MVLVKPFGEFEGKQVDQFTLVSATGVEVDIINWGVTVRDWRVPVGGGMRSVVLGLERFEDYPLHSPHFGSLAGRVANRIAGATFDLGGESFSVVANEGPNSLHGGPEGLGRLVWDAEPDDATNSVVFSLVSPDGAMGYPGELHLKATYRLVDNRLRLELGASTDRLTPVSLVQHQYFNLGTGADVLDHSYWFAANAFTEVNEEDLIPTGNILEAKPGSKWHFRTAKGLRGTGGQPITYDGNMVLDHGRDHADPVAVVTAPHGDLTLKLWTDQPGLQFYNAVMTDMPEGIGLGGKTYRQFSGFCLEDQAFPDALHHPHFPSILVSPDKPYEHWCEIEIG